MIPVSCLLEVVLDRVRYSRDTKLSILVVLLGVAICTVNDMSVNAKGFVAALIAVWSTSLQQYVRPISIQLISKPYTFLTTFVRINGFLQFFWVSHVYITLQFVHYLQRKHSIGSFNLLGHTAPPQAASLLLVGPFMDYWLTNKRVDAYNYTFSSTVGNTQPL